MKAWQEVPRPEVEAGTKPKRKEMSMNKMVAAPETLRIFDNPDYGQLRTLTLQGEPWFAAVDVCRALDIGNPSQALTRLDDDEKMTTLISNEGAATGMSQMGFVSEPGLYSLVLGSRKPEAKAFKRWITHEVIPAIRKHGLYATDNVLDNLDTLIEVATALRDERAQKAKLEEQRALLEEEKGKLEATTQEQAVTIKEQADSIKEHEKTIREMEPKVKGYERTVNASGMMAVTVIAQDYGMTGAQLNSILHDYRVIRKVSGAWILYRKYEGKGYTIYKDFAYKNKEDIDCVRTNMYWTPRGRAFLQEFLKAKGYLCAYDKMQESARQYADAMADGKQSGEKAHKSRRKRDLEKKAE